MSSQQLFSNTNRKRLLKVCKQFDLIVKNTCDIEHALMRPIIIDEKVEESDKTPEPQKVEGVEGQELVVDAAKGEIHGVTREPIKFTEYNVAVRILGSGALNIHCWRGDMPAREELEQAGMLILPNRPGTDLELAATWYFSRFLPSCDTAYQFLMGPKDIRDQFNMLSKSALKCFTENAKDRLNESDVVIEGTDGWLSLVYAVLSESHPDLLEIGESVVRIQCGAAKGSVLAISALLEDSGLVAESRIAEDSIAPRFQKALAYIKQNGPVVGTAIAHHCGIKSTTFRTHWLPKLRQFGVKSTENGYVAD